MAKKDMIRRQFDEMEGSYSTSRTDMGFQFSINRQLERITMVKSMIASSDKDQDFIESVLVFERCVEVLENILTNEADGDKKYEKVLDEIKIKEKKIIPFEDFIKFNYNTIADRRDAIDTGRGGIRHNRYRAEIKLKLETLRWKGLMKLMKRHNLLLQSEETDSRIN